MRFIRVTCALIINKDGAVLAAQRSKTMSLPLKWEFPGGKIEPDETPADCLIREIREELDVDIVLLEALKPHTHQYPEFTIELIPFIAHIVQGEIQLKEHAQIVWANGPGLLALDWAAADVPIVQDFLNR